jgi:hypothetical protein
LNLFGVGDINEKILIIFILNIFLLIIKIVFKDLNASIHQHACAIQRTTCLAEDISPSGEEPRGTP